MHTRELGTTGLTVSALGLGCMGMSEFYGAGDDAESTRVIHRALELGVTLLDTSDMYGPHTNEQLVGKAIADRRDQVVLATKFGIMRDPDDSSRRGVNGTPEYVRESVEGSLQRLGVDHIDLYYQHRVDPDTPIEETIGAMAELVARGQGPLPGDERGGARHPAPRRRRAPDRRAADRVLAVVARPRGRGPARVPRPRRRLRRLLAARPRLPLRRDPLDGRPRRGRLPPPQPALPGRELREEPRARRQDRGAREGEGRHARRSSRSPGSCTRATTSSRSPAPSASSAWRRTSPRPRSRCPRTSCAPSTRRCRSPAASATPRRAWRRSTGERARRHRRSPRRSASPRPPTPTASPCARRATRPR